MPSIQITSTNYNGQTAQVTFYSVSAPSTPVILGPQTLPYSRSGDDVYGSYELNFTAYNKVCYAVLNGTTTTTTTTTAAPTTTTTTAAPTTTTTTAAPISSYTISNAGSAVNGCYTQAGTYNGKPYYTNEENGYFIWYEGFEFAWFMSNSLGGGPPEYVGNDENNVPTSWSEVIGAPPAPTASSGCSAPATTTTTAAPALISNVDVSMFGGDESGETVVLFWDGSSNFLYSVELSTNGGSTWTYFGDIPGEGYPLTLSSGTYIARVAAKVIPDGGNPGDAYITGYSSPSNQFTIPFSTTTTTTTTTAAPTLSGYNIGSITRGDDDYAGNYTISGTSPGNTFPSWQHESKNYILVYQGGGAGWLLFPGTIEGGISDSPIAFQSCGFPAGGDGSCTEEIVTGTYATNDGVGTLFTVTQL
jgi:hypothetical protein